ncbi:transcription termination/antitermination protein NusG [Aestuariirhabdus litorea]|uniref:transcription termination/antitermination protein NusG n=1 Tax=Aestuariirhabdus litorea TaxID=2528527 RepID=UPI0013E2CC28|nr:transcription termination/antitermination NusG family protein [Aestuariirhabdus litorea]
MTAENEWFVVRTRSREESRAEQQLLNQGYRVYLPWLPRPPSASRPGRQPLFPGYLFVAVEEGDRSYASVRSTRGVLGFVRLTGKPARVSNTLIQQLQAQEQALAEEPRWQPQQPVRITQGPFADLEAIYLCDRGEDRCLLLLSLLGGQQQMEFPLVGLQAR